MKHKDIKLVLDLSDKNGDTPLMHAAFRGHADVVSKLIDVGADITVQNHKKIQRHILRQNMGKKNL